MSQPTSSTLLQSHRWNVQPGMGEQVVLSLRHALFDGHEVMAATMAANIFRLLAACGVPVAFLDRSGADGLTAQYCEPRHRLLVSRMASSDAYGLMNKGQQAFPRLMIQGESSEDSPPDEVLTLARRAFLVLEKAWLMRGLQLANTSFELGVRGSPENKIWVLTGVVDYEAMELHEDGQPLDSTDDRSMNQIARNQRRACELSAGFLPVPKQSLIVWSASDKDKIQPFIDAYTGLLWAFDNRLGCELRLHIRSMHKEPVLSSLELTKLVHQYGDCVIIAFVGRSNGLGPGLAPNTHVPVISVPAGLKDFPEDVWSSLRTPSDNPALTVLDPGNAMLAALNILAGRNPALYAQLRLQLEKRQINVVPLP